MSSTAFRPVSRRLVDLGLVGVGLLIFALDQVTKHLVTQSLGPGAPRSSVEVIGSFLRLAYTTNTGAAFGLLPDRTVIFTLVALLAVPLLMFSRAFVASDSLPVRLSLGLLLGGTLGNLADRVRLGYVVDFIDVGIGQVRWYSFNVADSAFVAGVAALAIYMLFFAPPESGDRERAEAGESRPEKPEAAEDQPDRHFVA